MPTDKLNFFAAYNHLNQQTTTEVYYSFFNGWAGTAFSPGLSAAAGHAEGAGGIGYL